MSFSIESRFQTSDRIALGGYPPWPYIWSETAEIQSGRLPGDTPVAYGRSNGVDMDALIKPLRGNQKPSDVKAPEFRPAELDPAEFLAAAVRADQPRPSRAEAEHAVKTLLGYIGENIT